MTLREPPKFYDTFLGRCLVIITVAGSIFAGTVYLEAVRQTANESLRVSHDNQVELEQIRHLLDTKANRDDVDVIREDIRSFRMAFERNLRVPDLVYEYRDKPKRKKFQEKP